MEEGASPGCGLCCAQGVAQDTAQRGSYPALHTDCFKMKTVETRWVLRRHPSFYALYCALQILQSLGGRGLCVFNNLKVCGSPA